VINRRCRTIFTGVRAGGRAALAFALLTAAVLPCGARATDPAPAPEPTVTATAPTAAQAATPAAAPAATPTAMPALAPAAVPGSAPAAPENAVVVTPVAEPGAAKTDVPKPAETLDGRIQDIKGEALELNRDLMVLEEELLFPANTQVAVFVSLDVGKLFALDSVQVKLDDKDVANYLYTPAEVESLFRGGVQRLYLGNLRAGPHQLVAYFVGKGPHDRDYRRGTTLKFDKGTDPKYIELQIKDSTGKLQPEFSVKVWQ
jgi:hypothetical protein